MQLARCKIIVVVFTLFFISALLFLNGCCCPLGRLQQIVNWEEILKKTPAQPPELPKIPKPPEALKVTRRIPNGNFEKGTTGDLPIGWTQENYYAAQKDKGSYENELRLTSDAHFNGDKSLYLYVKVIPPEKVLRDPSLPMGAQFVATKITSPYFNAENRDKICLYIADIKDDHKSYWGWAEYIFLVFDDGDKQIPELVKPEQIEPATSEALYSHHEAAYGRDEGPKNNSVAQVQGNDSKMWYKYEKTIPAELTKSRLKISIVLVAYNWNSWGTSCYNEIGVSVDGLSSE